MAQTLPISDLVNVQVTLTPIGARQPNINSLLLVGPTDIIDTTERLRTYADMDGVAAEFGNTTPEYLAALLWFGQVPQPTQLFIGRWAQAATKGRLTGGRVSTANQLMSAWTGITTGAFNVTIDAAPLTVATCNFSAQTNLNGVASIIQTRLLAAAAPVGTTVVWDANYQRFVIKNGTTGATSIISFLTSPGAGVDISSMLEMRSTSSGAYATAGIAAEVAVDSVELMDSTFGTSWYSVSVLGASDDDVVDVAAFIEAANPKHFQWVTSQAAGALTSADTSSLPYVLKNLGYSKTAVQYSSTSAYAAISAAARILTTAWLADNSTMTLMWKSEPGVVAESINETQKQALLARNCNFYANYDIGIPIIEPGVCCSGQFIDTVIGADFFAGRIQVAVFNLLYTTATKIPQTDAGSNMIASAIAGECQLMVNNGWLAPGQWNSNGIGQIQPGDFLPKGFHIHFPPIATQSETDRASRVSVPFTVLAKLAGAVHTVDVNVLVNP